jgi:cytochrome P450
MLGSTQVTGDFLTGETALAVLASPDFDVMAFGPRHAGIAAKMGVDLSEIIQIMTYVPLALRGDAHRAARVQAARIVGLGHADAMAVLPGVAQHLAHVLQTPGRHDLMADVVGPMTESLVSALIGVPLQSPPDAMISRVFSETIGMAKRRRMNEELATLRARVAVAFPDEDDAMHGARVSMAVLGRDATVGTIGMSLHDWLQGVTGVIGQHAFPPQPTRTGVPMISRQALRDTTVQGCPVAQGTIVSCDMTSLETGNVADHLRFFGAGGHVCLGRRLTLGLFAAMADAVAGVTTRLARVDMTLRRDDIFAIPQTLWVSVQA